MVVDDSSVDSDVAGLRERYRLGDVLGLGGAATVYRAWDRRLERPVAVKLYTAGVVGREQPPHRAEVAALARLRHPGLVALFDAGVEADRAYIVMQLVDGETLAQRLRREALSVTDVRTLGSQLAGTLSYVHENGVVHRDIKPSNVLLDGAGRPFLADFGVSRLVDATRSTTTGVVLGTPAFLAPEQVRGQRVGSAADIYALGLVLLEAVTGVREYPGGAVESAVARLHRSPEIPTRLPRYLRVLLAAMTADDPAARPDAADVASRLRTPATSDPGHAPLPEATGPRGRRRASGAVLAAMAASVLGVALLSGQGELAPPDPQVPLGAEQPNSTTTFPAPGLEASPPVDPSRAPEQAAPREVSGEAVERADVQNLVTEQPPIPPDRTGGALPPTAGSRVAETDESDADGDVGSGSDQDAESNGNGKAKSSKKGQGKGKAKGSSQSEDRNSKQ